VSNKGEAKSVLTRRGRYTLEFKLEAVRLVKGGQDIAVTSKVLGMPHQTLWSWVKLSDKVQLTGVGDKPVSTEQMELARLKMERVLLPIAA
jgi:transposase